MKKRIIGLIVMVITSPLFAHEFWLSSNKFFFYQNETAIISFNVGEGFEGSNWKGNRNKAKQLYQITPSGKKIDLKDSLSLIEGDSMYLKLTEEGTYMVAYNSINSFITLAPEKFAEYAKEDGLTYIIKEREKRNESNKPSNEYYQRSVKTLVQVGNKISSNCTKPTDLPLDIVPLKNPYAIEKKDESISFKVNFKNKLLKNYLIKVWLKKDNKLISNKDIYTDQNGIINVTNIEGIHMISCVYMERNTTDKKADWQSYWGSITYQTK